MVKKGCRGGVSSEVGVGVGGCTSGECGKRGLRMTSVYLAHFG